MKPHSFILGSQIVRRKFLKQSAMLAGGATLALHAQEIKPNVLLSAAIIGHTGRGDYGHGLDMIFHGIPNVNVIAVADPDEKGRAAAAKTSKAARQYADYREMLAKEKPQLASIAPRWTDQHHAMALAALKNGAHIYIEKPFTQTLAEADELIALADKSKLKIAVAHQMRLAPNIVHLKRALDAGLVGELMQVRAWGKQDARAGGEDMLVLGTHLFDLLRNLVGNPVWCTAQILHQGREFNRGDARTAKEQIGFVGGDEVEAQFAFPKGVFATFTSRAKLRETLGHWGIDLIGSKGVVRILMDIFPEVYLLQSGAWTPAGKTDSWQRLKEDPTLQLSAEEKGFGPANRRVVDDWLEAIRLNR
ncbi:MAG: Gfo/Idh/MocA family oxidoreductase, partial [Verrucomicrobiota bacterium]